MIRSDSLTPPFCLLTDYQTAGRGQRRRSWESEEGSNILASFLAKPVLDMRDLPSLNMAASLAVHSCLAHFGIEGVRIKWPNDLLQQRSKIAGILVENILEGKTIKHSIIGIGLNVNQKYFPRFSACSMRTLSGAEYNREEVLNKLYDDLYYFLSLSPVSLLQKANAVLFGLNQEERFVEEGQEFRAKVLKMNNKGNLVVQTNHGIKELEHHQTKWMI